MELGIRPCWTDPECWTHPGFKYKGVIVDVTTPDEREFSLPIGEF